MSLALSWNPERTEKAKKISGLFLSCVVNKKKHNKIVRGKKFSLPSFVPHSKHASEEQDTRA